MDTNMNAVVEQERKLMALITCRVHQTFADARAAGVPAEVFGDIESIVRSMDAALPTIQIYDQLVVRSMTPLVSTELGDTSAPAAPSGCARRERSPSRTLIPEFVGRAAPYQPHEARAADSTRGAENQGQEAALTSHPAPADETRPVVSTAGVAVSIRHSPPPLKSTSERADRAERSESLHRPNQSGRHAGTTSAATGCLRLMQQIAADAAIGSSVTGRGRPTHPASERGGGNSRRPPGRHTRSSSRADAG